MKGVWVVEAAEPDSPTGWIIIGIFPAKRDAKEIMQPYYQLRFISWGERP